MRITSDLKSKCKKIKLVVTDVDGVLTDGGRFFSEKGEVMKKFHARDGMGINLLLRNGIKTVILTKENSLIVKKWANEMNVSHTYSSAIKKEQELSRICKKFEVTKEEIVYIGDDVNDIALMKLVGLSAAPYDANPATKQIANYICNLRGGEGAFREVADLILSIKFPHKKKWY